MSAPDTTPTTPEERAELARLDRDATPAPWVATELPGCVDAGERQVAAAMGAAAMHDAAMRPPGDVLRANAEMIALARNLAPRMLAEIERLEAALAEARRDYDAVEGFLRDNPNSLGRQLRELVRDIGWPGR